MKTETQTDQDGVLTSLLVPMQQKNLLVPNVSIAEVVPISELRQIDNAPSWHLGYLDWREERVEVISFEVANEQTPGYDARDARIAVFNAITGQMSTGFFGMLVQGIPRMVKLGDAEVREDSLAVLSQAEKMAVLTQMGKATIPDLDYLESLVAQVN